MTKNKVCMLAFAKGGESTEKGFPKYIGLGTFKVLGVNPTQAEYSKMLGYEIEKEPVYLSEKDGVKQIRFDFILKSIPEKCNGIEFITKASYFLNNSYRYNKDATKVQVINDFGETTWVSVEEAKTGVVPQSVAGWFEGPYKPAYVGEEDLVNMLKKYLNIPNRSYIKKGTTDRVVIDDVDSAKARLEQLSKYFSGDISEIKKIIGYQPDNKIKFALGIKNTDDGKLYQDIFAPFPVKNSVTIYDALAKAILEKQASGGYANSTFSVTELKEYSVQATTFAKPMGAPSDPFSNPGGKEAEIDDLEAVFGKKAE